MKTSIIAASLFTLGALSFAANDALAGSGARAAGRVNGVGGASAVVARGAQSPYRAAGGAVGVHVGPEGGTAMGRAAGYTGYHGSAAHAGAAGTTAWGSAAAGRAGVVVTPYTATGYAAGVAVDAYGNAVGGAEVATYGAFGHTGVRVGTTQRSSDGRIEHVSGFVADGNRGSVESAGSFARDGLGTLNGSRSTEVSTYTGSTYDGSTSYAAGQGASHTTEYTTAYGTTYTWTR